jgi:hypothetical protein
MTSAQLVVVYDLGIAGGWEIACEHGRTWGRLYADIHTLDEDHIAVVFRSGDERWRPWELVRLSWILNDDLEERAA